MLAPDAVKPRPCLNCGAMLTGEFCATCGQRDIEPRVTVAEFAHEFAADHFGLDTKVARTLGTLIRHPGRLTAEFFAGRRIRYVPPLRLYISLSVLFFLVSAWTNSAPVAMKSNPPKGIVRIDNGNGDTVTIARPDSTTLKASTGQTGARAAGSSGVDDIARDTLHDNALTRFVKRRAHQRLVDLRARKTEATQRMGEAFRHDLPDALFVLVPVLAGLLALLYRGQHRSYAEHFVFALHFQAFVFATFFLTLLPWATGGVIVAIAMPVYMFLALRTVYAESTLRTTGKLFALGSGYVVASAVIMGALGLVVFLFG